MAQKISEMGYEEGYVGKDHEWVLKQLPTSDSKVGRGLHFTHTVLS